MVRVMDVLYLAKTTVRSWGIGNCENDGPRVGGSRGSHGSSAFQRSDLTGEDSWIESADRHYVSR